jgi:hypothetical protein
MTAFTETEVIARMTFHSKSKDKKTRRIKEFSFMFAPTETNYLTFLQTILKKHDLFQYTVSDQCTFPCTVKLPPSNKSTLYVVNFAKYKILANNILKEQPTSPITVFINMAAVETAFSQENSSDDEDGDENLPHTSSSPYIFPLLMGAVGATAGIILTPVLAPAVLGVVGFSAAGPVAGTLAASIQAGIGNVVAGSLFATAQSVAMGGAVPAAITAIGAGVAAVGGAAVAATRPPK